MSWQGLEVVHVVAMDKQHAIGVNNQLPWHLSDDLKHFKALTQNGVVLMGRKTYDSMGRVLPKRVNWVLTRDTSWHAEGVKVAHSLNELMDAAAADVKALQQSSIFIIGGGELFTLCMPFTDRLEITHVDLQVNGDAFYPAIPAEFKEHQRQPQQDASSGVRFDFVSYQRQNTV